MRPKRTQPTPPGRRVTLVVLHHLTPAGSHFDWMFEHPHAPAGRGRLVTFRLPVAPVDCSPRRAIVAERLPDHRRAYLSYEGPISDNRGRVVRVDAGAAIVHRFCAALLDATLITPRFVGHLHWRRRGACWQGKTLDAAGSDVMMH